MKPYRYLLAALLCTLPTAVFAQNNGVFDATQYGVATGTVDNGSGINSAITACNTAGGGIVVLPAGQLNVATTITMKSGCVVRGAGRGMNYANLFPSLAKQPTLISWNGSTGSSQKVFYFTGNISASGVQNLTITGGISTPTRTSLNAIYIDSSSDNYFAQLDIHHVGVAFMLVDSAPGNFTPSSNTFKGLGVEHVAKIFEFNGGTANYIDDLRAFNIFDTGIDFVANCDSNVFGSVMMTLYDADGATGSAKGVVFNSGNPGSGNDVFGESFDYLYIGMGPPTGQTSILVNYTADGGINIINRLEIQSPQNLAYPRINSGGYLTYNQMYGANILNKVEANTQTFIGPSVTIDATFCQSGGGSQIISGATNNRGQIKVGATAGACIVSFGNIAFQGSPAWVQNPVCVVTNNDATTALRVNGSPSANSFTVTGLSGGQTFTYICM